jgi:hypothetical protein
MTCFAGSDQTLTMFDFGQNVVACGLLSVVCIALNTLAMVVLQRDKRCMSMTVLLQGLAMSDSLFLVYTLLYTTLRSLLIYIGRRDIYFLVNRYIVTYVLPFG